MENEPCQILCEPVKKLEKEIFGNGKPEEALRTRFIAVEKTIKQIKYLCWVIFLGIGGLLANILESFLDGVKK